MPLEKWELNISERTVEFHLKNIYTKFKTTSRVELILKLGKLTGGLDAEKLGQSTVARRAKIAENRAKLDQTFGWAKAIFGKEIAMKPIGFHYLLGSMLAALLIAGLWVVGMIITANLDAKDFRGFLIPFLLLFALTGWVVGRIGAHRIRSLHSVIVGTMLATGVSPLLVIPLMRYAVVPAGRILVDVGLLDLTTMSAKTASDLAAGVMLGLWFGLSVLFGTLLQHIPIQMQVSSAQPAQRGD